MTTPGRLVLVVLPLTSARRWISRDRPLSLALRKSNCTPSIVPDGNDRTTYLVADDLGKPGRAWREADYGATNLEAVILDPLTGQRCDIWSLRAARHRSCPILRRFLRDGGRICRPFHSECLLSLCGP